MCVFRNELGLPAGPVVKAPCLHCKRHEFELLIGEPGS